MKLWYVPTTLVLAFMLTTIFIPGSTLAQSETVGDDTLVMIAEDKTEEADCKMRLMENGEKEYEGNCPPGSIIFTRIITLEEAEKSDITDYIVLEDDQSVDIEEEQALVMRAREAAKNDTSTVNNPNDTTAQACDTGQKMMDGSYLTKPSDPGSARVSYEVEYRVNGVCGVRDLQDRSKISAGSLNWLRSCTNGFTQCTSHRIPLNQNFTAFQNGRDSDVGNEYIHVTAPPCLLCGTPFGFFTLE